MNELIKYAIGEIEEKKEHSDKVLEYYSDKLANYVIPSIEDISSLKEFMKEVVTDYQKLNREILYDYNEEDIKYIVKHNIDKKKQQYATMADNKRVEFIDNIGKLNDLIRNEIQQKIDNENNLVKQDNSVFEQLEEKRKQLSIIQDKVLDMCSNYHINTSDIKIDNSTFSIEELNIYYDNAIEEINKEVKRVNPVSIIKDKVYNSIVAECIILILAVLFVFTEFFSILAIAVFLYIIYMQYKQKSEIERCCVLAGLIFNINPMSMGIKSLSSLTDKEIDELIENDERVVKMFEDYEKIDNDLQASAPEKELSEKFIEFVSEFDKIMEEANEYKKKKLSERDDTLYEIKNIIEFVNDQLELAIKEQKGLGYPFDRKIEFKSNNDKDLQEEIKKFYGDINDKKHEYLNSRFILGRKDDTELEYIDIKDKNIIVRPYRDMELMKMFIQCLYVNFICNVKLRRIRVTVYDPNDMGNMLIGFFNKDIPDMLIIEENFEEAIKRFRELANNNNKNMKGDTIRQYNEECEKTGKTPIDYNLLFVLSQSKNIEGKEELESFMEYSAKLGVIIVVISDDLQSKNAIVFDRPFYGVTSPYMIDTREFPRIFSENIKKPYDFAITKGIMYNYYRNKTFADKVWYRSTLDRIHLSPGFENGDPNFNKEYSVGNSGDIHGLIFGTTGAGKSVFINNLIATLARQYSPDELRLWLADFKGSEFALYLKTEEFPYQLPHLEACLCTSDPDYSDSLFEAIRKVADERYNILKELHYTNLIGYNEACRRGDLDGKLDKHGKPYKPWPRILMLVDEFTVIFVKADGKIIARVTQNITQLINVARAAGVHVIFASQSMQGTISADLISKLTLRFGLRCDQALSNQLMGTPYSGDIRDKNGTLYVRSIDDATLQSQSRIKTPYISPDEIKENVKELSIKASKEKLELPFVIEYDETTKHSIEELRDTYEQFYSTNKDNNGSGIIFMGRRMAYSINLAPSNLVLGRKNKTNMFCVFSDMEDFVNFSHTIQRNIRLHKSNPRVFCNSQSDAFHFLCKLDEFVPDTLINFSNRSTTIYDVVDTIKKIYQNKKENNETDMEVYFILYGWETEVKFGIEPDQKLLVSFIELLSVMGEYNMHVIFMCNSLNKIPISIRKACSAIVCGKVDDGTSTSLLDSGLASKQYELRNGYAFLSYEQKITKFKIYQSVLDREIESTEVVFG